jgi:hypothetical protein
VARLLQQVVSSYQIAGLGWERLMERLPVSGPVRSTVREWSDSFAYGAGELLFDLLTRQLLALDPLIELPDGAPPHHLDRVPDLTKRHPAPPTRKNCARLSSTAKFAR